MELQGTSWIGARRGTGGGGEWKAVNPATGEELEPAYIGETEKNVDAACRLAEEASREYRGKSGAEKAAFLRTIADEIDGLEDEIVTRMTAESALPEGRCRMEKGRTCFQLRMFAEVVEEGSWVDARIDHADPDRAPVPKPDVRSMWRPLGPVVVFCASNFPLAYSVAGGDTASALAAGCPVIVNAHWAHPGTAEIVGTAVRRAVEQCGMPEGVFSVLFGKGVDVGQALVKHPAVRAVGFTGSRRGGRALMNLAAARPEPIPVWAEMSAVNPVFILPGAMKERGEKIAQGFVGSLTLGVGQFCTNPGLVFTGTEGRGAFAELVAAGVAETPAGTMLHPGIAKSFHEGIGAMSGKAETLARVEGNPGANEAGAVVFGARAGDFLADASMAAEMFGPASLLVEAEGEAKLLEIAEGLEGQLTASVHATEEDRALFARLIAVLERKAGRLVYNGFPTGVEVCHGMIHGGPYPATSDGRSTSVGPRAITRFARMVCWQDFPDGLLPAELQEKNPLGLSRIVDGKRS
ncbi:MAG: aldehyde dehydrogenase (NADP(+)) [Akkermansiaceae bacterium]|nr:aldehyde dehydrogenase (NADP(+)) [Akkermansiaceae bacterium]NNM29016.1 aldehyde dehydrogenase (NADP(+)) [Akkermansiaceae bacterium]